VTVGRGSVLQTVIGTFLSFLFFAFHVKMWPMKTNEDNILKATCEIHVFWTITTAFVMKSDLTHEKLRSDFYDDALLYSFLVCVPLTFFLTIWSKLRRANLAMLDDIVQIPHDKRRRGNSSSSGGGGGANPLLPQKEFRKYTLGLASMDDRCEKLLSPPSFLMKNKHSKTGSGQTQGTLKNWYRCIAAES
jgi:hypothetical protein